MAGWSQAKSRGGKKRKWQNCNVRLHLGLGTCFGEKAGNIKIGEDMNTEVEKMRIEVL